MPSRPHLGHGVQREIGGRRADRLKHLGEHLQHFDVEDEFFIRCRQPAFEPACRVQHEIAAAQQGAPQAHLRFIGRLRIGDVRGRRVRGPPGQTEKSRHLARAESRLHVFRRTESRRSGFHIDVRGEAAVNDGRSGFHDLSKRETRERFGVRERQRSGDRHRRHRPGQGERGDDQHLPGSREIHDPLPSAIGMSSCSGEFVLMMV